MKKHAKSLVLLVAILAFGLGAFTQNIADEIMVELGQRYYRDSNHRDMFGAWSSEAYWYFTGRMEARNEDLVYIGFRTIADPVREERTK